MRDDFLSDEWAANRHHLTDAIHKLVRRTLAAFEVLNRVQFDAPWQRRSRCTR